MNVGISWGAMADLVRCLCIKLFPTSLQSSLDQLGERYSHNDRTSKTEKTNDSDVSLSIYSHQVC